MTTIGTLRGGISVGFGDQEPVEVGAFEVPVVATIEGPRSGDDLTVTIQTAPDTLRAAIAGALREAADQIEADGAPRDLAPADLEPGYVVIRCADCDSQTVGRPGDRLEHGRYGSHIHHVEGYGGKA
ncbi:hypothetical protein ACWKWN_18235 [Microbacterium trichothecenolyticum]